MFHRLTLPVAVAFLCGAMLGGYVVSYNWQREWVTGLYVELRPRVGAFITN